MRRKENEMYDLKFRWEQRMHSPEFNELSHIKQAAEIGVGSQTVDKWHREASPAFWKNVAETIRNQYAVHAPEVDIALIKQAKGGSLGHQELFYKRFEGWSPKNTQENINTNADLADEDVKALQRKAAAGLSREELLRLAAEKGSPPTDVVDGTNG